MQPVRDRSRAMGSSQDTGGSQFAGMVPPSPRTSEGKQRGLLDLRLALHQVRKRGCKSPAVSSLSFLHTPWIFRWMTIYGFVISQALPKNWEVRHYLIVSSDGERTVLQLFRWKMRQDVGHISGNIDSSGECNLLVAIATNWYFPALDVEVKSPLDLSSDGQNNQKKYFEGHTAPKRNRPKAQCRRRRMAYPKLSAVLAHSLSPHGTHQFLCPLLLHTPKERITWHLLPLRLQLFSLERRAPVSEWYLWQHPHQLGHVWWMHCWNSRPGSPWRHLGLWSWSP